MNRLITTVKDAWDEYSKDQIGPNNKIIICLKNAERKYGAKWRKDKETQFWIRRQVFIT